MGREKETQLVRITRFFEGERIPFEDRVARESPLIISVNGKEVVTLTRLPGSEPELAVGFLLTGGAIGGSDDIARVCCHGFSPDTSAHDRSGVVIVSMDNTGSEGAPDRVDVLLDPEPEPEVIKGCRSIYAGVAGIGEIPESHLDRGKVASDSGFDPVRLLKLGGELDGFQEVFRTTGGTHGAMLFDSRCSPVATAEDVGRYNALDKVMGEVVLAGGKADGSGLLVSGRLSMGMVYKAARAGVSLLCSVSAPTSMAVELAQSIGCTLVGFLRGKGFNIYTHPERLGSQR